MPNNPGAAYVKKIRPYPFEGILDPAAGKKAVEILFINKDGFIAKLNLLIIHVGEHYKVQFELPASSHSVSTDVRVMKTYDRALPTKVAKVERMAEFRFEKLSEVHKHYISAFITAIGQKK